MQRGTRLFMNVTDTSVLPGAQPIQAGHSVPSLVPDVAYELIGLAVDELIDLIDFQDGMLHAEFLWDDAATHLSLIECAGRPPGDRIVDCIDAAYGVNLHHALVELLSGRTPSLPRRATAGAAVRFVVCLDSRPVTGVTPPPDKFVQSVGGEVEILLSRRVGAPASGWDRLASAFARAPGARAAAAAARALADAFVVSQADCPWEGTSTPAVASRTEPSEHRDSRP